MPLSRYTEPTADNLRWLSENPPILTATGKVQEQALGTILVGCGDGRLDGRGAASRVNDHAAAHVYERSWTSALEDQCIIHDNYGNPEVNWKAVNILRHEKLKQYVVTEAGGRYSQSAVSFYATTLMHEVGLAEICLTDHEPNCAAAAAGLQLPWESAVIFTLHDLWQFQVRGPVPIYTGQVTTHGSMVRNITLAAVYDPEEYESTVGGGAIQLRLPTQDGSDHFTTTSYCLDPDQDAGAEYRRFLRLRMIEGND